MKINKNIDRKLYIALALLMLVTAILLSEKLLKKSSKQELWFWCYTAEADTPLLYRVTPGDAPRKQPLPSSIQQGKFGVDMYFWKGNLYWTVMEETGYSRLFGYDLESGKEQVIIDKAHKWTGSVFSPITTDGRELFVTAKGGELQKAEQYRYWKVDFAGEKLIETELYGSWYPEPGNCFYDRDRILLQEKGGYYYYLSSLVKNEILEPTIACYDKAARQEYQFLVFDMMASLEAGKAEHKSYTLFLRENCFYLDYQDEKGIWHGYRIVFQKNNYNIEEDKVHPGGDWERVAVLEKKQIFMKKEDCNASYFLEYDWETERMEKISIPKLHTNSFGILQWVIQEQEAGYTLCRREGQRIAIEGAEERERCLVRWYQGEENAAWYERVIKEEETFQTME